MDGRRALQRRELPSTQTHPPPPPHNTLTLPDVTPQTSKLYVINRCHESKKSVKERHNFQEFFLTAIMTPYCTIFFNLLWWMIGFCA